MRMLMILILAFTAICCKSSYQRDPFTYNPDQKKVWIDSYKYEVFYGCIKEGIGNDSLRIILRHKYLFNKNVNVDFAVTDDAREKGKIIITNMPKPFIKIDKGEEHLKGKNFISYNCLSYYVSRELDSIANEAYKRYNEPN